MRARRSYTEPHFRSIALLTIDLQTDFLKDEACEIAGTSDVLQPAASVAEAFRAAHLPIVHVVRIYEADGSNVDLCRREAVENGSSIVLRGTRGAELASAMRPRSYTRLDAGLLLSGAFQEIGPNEWLMYKPRWGAFYRTGLQEQLASWGTSTLAFAGCNFPNCPRTSIYEASERDFRVILTVDAVSGLYDRGILEMANIGVELMSSGSLATAVAATS
jgi:nicotinamidase-related amidase